MFVCLPVCLRGPDCCLAVEGCAYLPQGASGLDATLCGCVCDCVRTRVRMHRLQREAIQINPTLRLQDQVRQTNLATAPRPGSQPPEFPLWPPPLIMAWTLHRGHCGVGCVHLMRASLSPHCIHYHLHPCLWALRFHGNCSVQIPPNCFLTEGEEGAVVKPLILVAGQKRSPSHHTRPTLCHSSRDLLDVLTWVKATVILPFLRPHPRDMPHLLCRQPGEGMRGLSQPQSPDPGPALDPLDDLGLNPL